ncbi:MULTISPECIES: hypothetical protein [unclassified Rathayibacter]|uniref:hypothetical protein n=1 Tax=unclassified Rathayibacter TaxID=2609250 RepID=UPI0006F64F8E|nr:MULTISPECIES: hypothetical protein [unclassified Rathayibacter]KQQ05579.1 hypothetical protein ASF42_03145 [Rathayibacter sp. Leaf294]KQS13440.1 hypothetical protein ASG06_03155 [Rathayibacter sp. Leaf185]
MSAGQPARKGAAAPLVLGLLLVVVAVVLSTVSGIFAWDPEETCLVRGSYPSTEKFLGTAMCADGTSVQPMGMTVSAALSLVGAGICFTVAIVRRAWQAGRPAARPRHHLR